MLTTTNIDNEVIEERLALDRSWVVSSGSFVEFGKGGEKLAERKTKSEMEVELCVFFFFGLMDERGSFLGVRI